MKNITKSVNIDISLDDFDSDDIIVAAQQILGVALDELDLTEADKDFLHEHFEKMADIARSAGDIAKAFRFERYRDAFST